MATFQVTINLGASVPTSAQQTATDSLVSGVLAGVQSNGLAGYIVIAVNYSVVANFSTTTTSSSVSLSNSTYTSTAPSTTASTLTGSGIQSNFRIYSLLLITSFSFIFGMLQAARTSRTRHHRAARERAARTRSRPTMCRTTTRCSLCSRWRHRAARVASGPPSASTRSRLWYCTF